MTAARASNAYEEALKALARRALTAAELRQRLLRKDFRADEVEDAISRMVEGGYIREPELAARIVELMVMERGYGLGRASAELFRRGIPRELAAEALEGLPDEAEEEALRRSIERWCSSHGHPDCTSDRRRLADHLLRRGFARGLVGGALPPLPDPDTRARAHSEDES